MLSHRYGSRFLLEEIADSEFKRILQELRNNNSFHDENLIVKYLNRCYELDENDLCEKKYKIRSKEEMEKGLKVYDLNFYFKFLISHY